MNEALASTEVKNGTNYATEASCFFTSYYDRVEELNFEAFLRYFPTPDEEFLGDEDAEEFAALAALPGFPFGELLTDGQAPSALNLPVPVHRIREDVLNAALTKWAGITAEDIDDRSGPLYLDSYHSFYTFTSDFGPGAFVCVGGEVEGNIARLWSEPGGESPSRNQLTLEQRDGNWYIRSFQSIPLYQDQGQDH